MKGGHGLAVGKRQDGILLAMATSLRLGDSLHDENEQLRGCCAEQTGVHRMYCESTAFLSSYLRKQPHTYRHNDVHSTGLDYLPSIQLNSQLSVYKRITTKTRSIRNGNDHTRCVYSYKYKNCNVEAVSFLLSERFWRICTRKLLPGRPAPPTYLYETHKVSGWS